MTKKPYKFPSLLHSAYIVEKRLAALLTPVGITPRQARILNEVRTVRQGIGELIEEKLGSENAANLAEHLEAEFPAKA